MKFEIGINLSCNGNVKEELENILKTGYDYVYFDGDICLVDEKKFHEIKKTVEFLNVKVYSIQFIVPIPTGK